MESRPHGNGCLTWDRQATRCVRAIQAAATPAKPASDKADASEDEEEEGEAEEDEEEEGEEEEEEASEDDEDKPAAAAPKAGAAAAAALSSSSSSSPAVKPLPPPVDTSTPAPAPKPQTQQLPADKIIGTGWTRLRRVLSTTAELSPSLSAPRRSCWPGSTVIALVDKIAKTRDDLVFLESESIKVLDILGNDEFWVCMPGVTVRRAGDAEHSYAEGRLGRETSRLAAGPKRGRQPGPLQGQRGPPGRRPRPARRCVARCGSRRRPSAYLQRVPGGAPLCPCGQSRWRRAPRPRTRRPRPR